MGMEGVQGRGREGGERKGGEPKGGEEKEGKGDSLYQSQFASGASGCSPGCEGPFRGRRKRRKQEGKERDGRNVRKTPLPLPEIHFWLRPCLWLFSQVKVAYGLITATSPTHRNLGTAPSVGFVFTYFWSDCWCVVAACWSVSVASVRACCRRDRRRSTEIQARLDATSSSDCRISLCPVNTHSSASRTDPLCVETSCISNIHSEP